MISELISDRIWRKQIHNPAYYHHVAKHKWLVAVLANGNTEGPSSSPAHPPTLQLVFSLS
jgi:hypothetical protein